MFSSEKWLLEALKVVEYNQKTPFIFLVGTKKDLLVRFLIILKVFELNIKKQKIKQLCNLLKLQKSTYCWQINIYKDQCSDSIKNEMHTNAKNLAYRLNAEYWPLSSLTGTVFFLIL